MLATQEYHFNMRRSLTQMFLASVIFASAVFAQGPPASVTSPNFGGNGNRGGGPPASVTSPGFGGNRGSGPPAGITSQGFGNTNQNRFFSGGTNRQFHRNHPQRNNYFPQNNYGAVYAVPVPYYVPLDTVEPVDDTMEQVTAPPTQYLGGPTVFDRRGPGASPEAAPVEPAPREESAREVAKDVEAAPAIEPTPAKEQPQTLLVFKDGHHLEVQNYAIVGDMLYDMTPGHSHKVLLADLDLDATTKQNDQRGVDFRLPPHTKAQ